MIKQLQNVLKRNLWLVLVIILLFGLLSLLLPGLASVRSAVSIQDIYDRLSVQDSFFQVLRESVVKKNPDNKTIHVAFLKVHKTGSTTAQNMFLRFGWNHNLTFVLSPSKNDFKYPNIISLREGMTPKNTLPPPEGKHHDILCNHVVYNRTSFRKYMPNDTFYVGILREPYEYFKSVLNYLRPGYIFKKINTSLPVSEYLKDPRKYEPKSPAMSFTNNRLAFEFGCTADVIESSDAKQIIQFVKSVDSDFGLVIITELFEESILLLRRYLNWSTKDVIYLDKNIAKNKNTTSFVGPYDRQLYKRWAKVDYALYEYFYRRLRDQIRREGDDFDEELLHFAENRKMASEFCSAGEANKKSNSKLIVHKSKWSEGFEITSSDCDLLRKAEIPFVQDIRFRQYGSMEI